MDNFELLEKYINSVVFPVDRQYGVLLLRIYEDGVLTSGGFYPSIRIPDEPIDVAHSHVDVLFSYVSATELPDDWYNYEFLFANEREILEEAVDAPREDLNTIKRKMFDIDLINAITFAQQDKPIIESPATEPEHLVFMSDHDTRWSWCLLLG